MERLTMRPLFFTLVLALLTAAACTTPSAPDFNYEPAYLNDVAKGWTFFSQANYSLAATSFRSAVNRDVRGERPEAHIGLGWALAMQDSLQKSIFNLDLALSRTPTARKDSVFILSGLSFVHRDYPPVNYAAVRDNALLALEKAPNFVFDYNSSINYLDLNAVLAEAYFNLGQYTEAAQYADPSGSLDSLATDYHQQLLVKINQMLTISREGV